MERQPENVLQFLEETDLNADKILMIKSEKVELDRRRQKIREAQRALQKDNPEDKVWIGMGNTFIKLTVQDAKHQLESDFKTTNELITNSEQQLKAHVERLRDMEHKDPLKGFGLEAFSKNRDDLNIVGL